MELPKYFHWNQLYVIVKLLEPNISHNDWERIYKNRNITWNMVMSESWPRFYRILSYMPDLDLNYVINNLDKNWDRAYIVQNHANMTPEIARLLGIALHLLVTNKHIGWETIKQLNLPHERLIGYIHNPGLTWQIYKTELRKICRHNIDPDDFTLRDIINISIVLSYKTTGFAKLKKMVDKVFYWFAEFVHEHMEFINRYIEFPYFYDVIDITRRLLLDKKYNEFYKMQYITLQSNTIYIRRACLSDVRTTLKSFVHQVSKNPNIEYEQIKDELYKWNANVLIYNKALNIQEKIDLYKKHMDIPAHVLYNNIYFTPDIIKQNNLNILPTIDLMDTSDIKAAVQADSPYITWKQIIDNKHKLGTDDFTQLFCNNFKKHKHYRKHYLVRKYFLIWRANIHNKYVRVNRAIYDCCMHELHMRWRDAGR